MESLYQGQIIQNPYSKKYFLVITFYDEKKDLYTTHIIHSPNKYLMIEVPVQRYKMRTEALRGHNTWLRTLRQEDFAFRNIDTAELHIFNQGGILDYGNDRED